MTIATIHADEDQSQYIGTVYQQYSDRLRRYFLIQLGDPSEADNCVQETMRRFFFFLEDRDWEAEAEYISVYLMRIAGLICSRKLAEKRRQCADNSDDTENNSIFMSLQTLAFQAVKERIEFLQFVLRPVAGDSRQASRI